MSDPTPSPPAPSAEIEALNQLAAAQAARIAILEEQLRLAVHQCFAPESEKSSPLDQPDLFNEAGVAAPEASSLSDLAWGSANRLRFFVLIKPPGQARAYADGGNCRPAQPDSTRR